MNIRYLGAWIGSLGRDCLLLCVCNLLCVFLYKYMMKNYRIVKVAWALLCSVLHLSWDIVDCVKTRARILQIQLLYVLNMHFTIIVCISISLRDISVTTQYIYSFLQVSTEHNHFSNCGNERGLCPVSFVQR